MPRKDRVAGVRSVERAILSGRARRVMVARDAEERVTRPILALCREKGIEVEFIGTMKELGESCGLGVGASCAAILGTSDSAIAQGSHEKQEGGL